MTVPNRTSAALLPLALLLSACGAAQEARPEAALPVRPQASQCPRFPMPPASLMEPPAIVDFLDLNAS
jgi:hypothetical protein